MNRSLTAVIAALISCAGALVSQESWEYRRDIKFPPGDSAWARPYLCALDASKNLWVITTGSIDTATHNALFKAAPGESLFTKVYDFRLPPENDQFSAKGLSGLGAIGNSIVIFSRVDNTLGHAFRFTDGNPSAKQGFASGGYGTHMFGSSATRDSFVYSGISAWGISIRVHNFSSDAASSAFGTWVPFSTTDGSTAPKEPGGPTVDGSALIRDVALVPNGNYDDTATVFYTSRNAERDVPNGGVAVWRGGTQRKSPVNPEKYRGVRVMDIFADLQWGITSPNGITVDSLGRLWACGTDSTRRYVRVYTVDLSGDVAFATNVFELPSKNSPVPAPAGANMLAPADVAVTGKTAYVTDVLARMVFVFEKTTTHVNENQGILPHSIALSQNYPNPFNPGTAINYQLSKSSIVTLKVYDVLGREVATLVDEAKDAGKYAVLFNPAKWDLSSGMYFYQLRIGGVSITKKMIFSK